MEATYAFVMAAAVYSLGSLREKYEAFGGWEIAFKEMEILLVIE